MSCDDLSDGLVERVDALTAQIARRRARDLACRKGCTACCHVQLTLSPVEAARVQRALDQLPGAHREAVRTRAQGLREQGEAPQDAPCVMLEQDGACAIYAGRPLVCRTQGHALKYPRGSLPPEMVFATVKEAEVTWCPLNYIDAPPCSEDVLEAERIDLLAGQACLEAGLDLLKRVSMVELALE